MLCFLKYLDFLLYVSTTVGFQFIFVILFRPGWCRFCRRGESWSHQGHFIAMESCGKDRENAARAPAQGAPERQDLAVGLRCARLCDGSTAGSKNPGPRRWGSAGVAGRFTAEWTKFRVSTRCGEKVQALRGAIRGGNREEEWGFEDENGEGLR